MEGFKSNPRKWKEISESNGLTANLGRTKLMVTGGIKKDDLSKS